MLFARAALVVLAASVLLWTAEKARAQTPPQPVAIQGDGITLSGYLFVPADLHKKAPGVILLHGWGRSAELLADDAASLAAQGYVALTLSMRGWGQTGGNDDCGLQQPDDTVLALKWLAQRPEVNGARLGIIGFSKGGQVALLTAARTRSLKAIVAYFPITDIDSLATTSTQFGVQSYVSGTCAIGGTAARSPVVFRRADIRFRAADSRRRRHDRAGAAEHPHARGAAQGRQKGRIASGPGSAARVCRRRP